MPVPVAARSQAWVWGRSLAGIVGSNHAGGHGYLSLMSVVCCQVEELSRLPRKLLSETAITLFAPRAVIYLRGSPDTDGGGSRQISEGFVSLECKMNIQGYS